MTRLQSPPDRLDQTITVFRDRILPAAKGASGYSGAALYVDQDTGRAAGVTLWENARALAGSERVALATCAQAAESQGLHVIDVTRFEIVAVDQAQPPKVTGYIRVDNGSTPPESLDAFANFLANDVLPAVRQRHGYRSLALGIDRTSGLLWVTSTWETADDRAAGDSSFAAVLQRGREFGLRPILIEQYEQVAGA